MVNRYRRAAGGLYFRPFGPGDGLFLSSTFVIVITVSLLLAELQQGAVCSSVGSGNVPVRETRGHGELATSVFGVFETTWCRGVSPWECWAEVGQLRPKSGTVEHHHFSLRQGAAYAGCGRPVDKGNPSRKLVWLFQHDRDLKLHHFDVSTGIVPPALSLSWLNPLQPRGAQSLNLVPGTGASTLFLVSQSALSAQSHALLALFDAETGKNVTAPVVTEKFFDSGVPVNATHAGMLTGIEVPGQARIEVVRLNDLGGNATASIPLPLCNDVQCNIVATPATGDLWVLANLTVNYDGQKGPGSDASLYRVDLARGICVRHLAGLPSGVMPPGGGSATASHPSRGVLYYVVPLQGALEFVEIDVSGVKPPSFKSQTLKGGYGDAPSFLAVFD